ncbi:DUF2817 domain-containing protein [Spongorhabdus nitratireducens]
MEFTRQPDGYSVTGRPIPNWHTPQQTGERIYLIAGTHGDEPESVYVLLRLFRWLKGLPDNSALPITLIPALNPDGLAQRTRTNANGIDLNRNLPTDCWVNNPHEPRYFGGHTPMSEPENLFLNALYQQQSPALIISFHSWKPLLNSNGECDDILQHLAAHNGYPIVREEIEDHPTPGSLGTYASTTLGSPVLTFECPTIEQHTSMETIWQENKKALTSLFTSGILEKYLR